MGNRNEPSSRKTAVGTKTLKDNSIQDKQSLWRKHIIDHFNKRWFDWIFVVGIGIFGLVIAFNSDEKLKQLVDIANKLEQYFYHDSPQSPSVSTDSVARLKALRDAADSWQYRKDPTKYDDFSRIVKAITNDDKARFSDDDKNAWDILASAETLINWQNKGLTSETKSMLPIFVKRDGSLDLADRAAQALRDILDHNEFHIVVDATDAALFISIDDADQPGKLLYNPAIWRATTNLRIRATWIGGRSLFNQEVSGTEVGDKKVAEDASLSKAAANSAALLFTLTK
jgi:hypothetical protein